MNFPNKFQLTENARPRAAIVIAESADQVERFAAAELQRYVQKISGAKLAIEEDNRASAGMNQVCIGRTTLNSDEPFDPPQQPPGDFGPSDTLAIVTSGRTLSLRGATPRATLFAVYALLEEIGCCWSAPGQDTLPTGDITVDGAMERRETPFINFRVFYFEDGDYRESWADWLAKNRVNVWQTDFQVFVTAGHNPGVDLDGWLAKRGLILSLAGHSVPELLNREKYKDHPEFFALIGGKRMVPNSGQLCMSNQQLKDTYAEQWIAYLEKYPQVQHISLWSADGYGWCECDHCKAIERERYQDYPAKVPVKTETYLRFMTYAGQRIHERFPDLLIDFGAYYNMTALPDDLSVIPDEPYWCMFVDSYYGNKTRPWHAPTNRRWETDQYRRWRAVFKHGMYFQQYTGDLIMNPDLPLVTVEKLREDMLYCRGIGIDGLFTLCVTGGFCFDEDGNQGDADPGEMFMSETARWYRWGVPHRPKSRRIDQIWDVTGLSLWATARLMWDPTPSWQQVLADYCTGHFGPAGDSMYRYFIVLTESVDRIPTDDRWSIPDRRQMLSEEVVTACCRHLAQAGDAADAEPFAARVVEATRVFEAAVRIRDMQLAHQQMMQCKDSDSDDAQSAANRVLEMFTDLTDCYQLGYGARTAVLAMAREARHLGEPETGADVRQSYVDL